MKRIQFEQNKDDTVATIVVLIILMIIFYCMSAARTKYDEKRQIPQNQEVSLTLEPQV